MSQYLKFLRYPFTAELTEFSSHGLAIYGFKPLTICTITKSLTTHQGAFVELCVTGKVFDIISLKLEIAPF